MRAQGAVRNCAQSAEFSGVSDKDSYQAPKPRKSQGRAKGGPKVLVHVLINKHVTRLPVKLKPNPTGNIQESGPKSYFLAPGP